MPANIVPTSGEAIESAAQLLRQGALVAFPTETVYGLGADAFNPLAVARSRSPRALVDHPGGQRGRLCV